MGGAENGNIQKKGNEGGSACENGKKEKGLSKKVLRGPHKGKKKTIFSEKKG